MNYERKQARNKFISLFEDILQYYKGIIITLLIGATLGFCLYSYMLYRRHQNQNAHKALMECLKHFEAPVTQEKDQEIDVPLADLPPDLLVSPQRSVQECANLKAEFFLQLFAGRSCGE